MTEDNAEPVGEGRRSGLAWGLIACVVLCVLAYAGSLRGEFVYDDTGQIVENVLIQDEARAWEALTSDVWAYKGERDRAWSNYWRPVFMAWLIGNHRLFGLETTGWHAMSVLLHLAVTLLAISVTRLLGFSTTVAVIVGWLFATHPAHVESVAWISGATDPLLSLFLLGSWALVLRPTRGRARAAHVAGSLVLYALATLAKEVSVVFPVLLAVTAWCRAPGVPPRRRILRAVVAGLPHAAVAGAYLFARHEVLGTLARTTPWSATAESVLLSVPEVATFYLRLAFWPSPLGPAYPLRPVTPGSLGVQDFWLPLAVLVAAVTAGLALWRHRPAYGVAGALAALTLAPAFNLSAFLPEQVVHDRYLYLPLLGLLVLVVGPAEELAHRLLGPRRGQRALVGVGLGLAALLALVTGRQARIWDSELALWGHAVTVDPGSSFTTGQLGHHLRMAGDGPGARRWLERSLEIDPHVTTTIGDLAVLDRLEGRLVEAEAGFRRILATYPDNLTAVHQLAATLEAQGRLREARATLDGARRGSPDDPRLTLNIAVLSERLGDTRRALSELAALRLLLASETDPELLKGHFLMGKLLAREGRWPPARAAWERYLERTSSFSDDPAVSELRAQARRRLESSP